MKVPMKWLGEHVQTGLTAKELAHRMTMAGLEAEKLEEIGELWDNVYVGYVRRVQRHPDADRLVLADVEAGEHKLTVVTGAPNIAEGQTVALALAGARLYDGHSEELVLKTLKPGMIRGIKSEGMVCSEKELGMSEEHEGILVLPADAPIGVPLKQYLGDTVIEFEITPNLVHAFSVQGIAREAAALTGKPVATPALADLSVIPAGPADMVAIPAGDLCARYMGIVFENVTIGPSPDWLVRRIQAAGMRSISNIVDVTNYVMHEMGQPTHAFDWDKVGGRRIVVRRAAEGETLETLDHVDRALTSDMLVIADAERPIALAGVIGGFDSEISDGTTTILLEGANFAMSSVRQTARALKMRSDASARFERGIDPNLVHDAMARATQLIMEVSPGARATAIQDVYPEPVLPRSLSMPIARIERLLGISYSNDQIADALTRLGFAPQIEDDTLTVTIPTVRKDVSIPEDIVEEVARVIGYEGLPDTLPIGRTVPVKRDPAYELRKRTRDILIACGASEAVTYVTVSADDLAAFETADGAGFVRRARSGELLKLRNPLQAGRDLMRPTLVPSLLESVAQNLRHTETVRLFETARVYLPRGRDELPDEIEMVTIAVAGKRERTGLHVRATEMDFFDVKGMTDEVLRRMGVAADVEPDAARGLHPGRSAVYRVGDRMIARLGELHPDTSNAFGIEDARVAVAEIDLTAVLELQTVGKREVTVPRFLPVHQDFAIVVEESVAAAAVREALANGAGPLATEIVLFDIYLGEQIGAGKKSMAFRITFLAPDRALTDNELIKVRGKIEKVLKHRVSGALRG